MWRRHQHEPSSNAELQIFQELQQRHLTAEMTTQEPFVFDMKKDVVAGTWVDFYWPRHAVFIDGPHHDKLRQGRRDEAVDKALRRRGICVHRFSYKPPLRKARRDEICDSIEEILNGKAC